MSQTATMTQSEGVCRTCGVSIPAVEIGDMRLQPAKCDRCVEDGKRHEKVRDFRSHLLASGLDEELWSYDQVLAPNPGLLAWCLAHVDGWMWLGGPTGVGKTRALARALVVHSWRQKAWPEALWLPAALWVEDLTGRQEEARSRQRRQIELAKRAEILVFDDFGQESLTDHSTAQLFGLLDHRYVRRLRTWFSTNASAAELEARIGASRWPQIRRRIAERGSLYTWGRSGWHEDGSGVVPEGTAYWWEGL